MPCMWRPSSSRHFEEKYDPSPREGERVHGRGRGPHFLSQKVSWAARQTAQYFFRLVVLGRAFNFLVGFPVQARSVTNASS